MPISAGQLNRKIVIQQYAETMIDGAHGYVWSTLATVWANKRDTTGREHVASQSETAFADCVWTIRYRSNLAAKLRVQEFGTALLWDIISISEIGFHEGIELICRKVGA